MLTWNAYLLIILGLIVVYLLCRGFNNSDDVCIEVATLLFVLSLILFGGSFISEKPNVVINNDGETPLKCKYVQFHPFTENSIETTILMPGQAKILKNVEIIDTVQIKID